MKIKNFDFATTSKNSFVGLDLTKNFDLSLMGPDSLSTPRDRDTLKLKNGQSGKKVHIIDDSPTDPIAMLDSLKKKRIDRTDKMLKELTSLGNTEETPKNDVSLILRDINNTIKDIRNLANRSKTMTETRETNVSFSKENSKLLEIDESAWTLNSSTANLKQKLLNKAQNTASKKLSNSNYSSFLPDSGKKVTIKAPNDNYDLDEYLPGKSFLKVSEPEESIASLHPRSKSSTNGKENSFDTLSSPKGFLSPTASSHSFAPLKSILRDTSHRNVDQGLENQKQLIRQYVRDIVENEIGNPENLTQGKLIDLISKILIGFLDKLNDNPILNPQQKTLKLSELLSETRVQRPKSVNILEKVPSISYTPPKNLESPKPDIYSSIDFAGAKIVESTLPSSRSNHRETYKRESSGLRTSYERSSSKQNRIKLLSSDEYPLSADKSIESPNLSVTHDHERSRLGQYRDSARDNSLTHSQTLSRNVSPTVSTSVNLDIKDLSSSNNSTPLPENPNPQPKPDPYALRESLIRAELALSKTDTDEILPKLTSDQLIAAKHSKYERTSALASSMHQYPNSNILVLSPRNDSDYKKYRTERRAHDRYRPYSVDSTITSSRNPSSTLNKSLTEERSSSLTRVEKPKEAHKSDPEVARYKPKSSK